MRNWVLDAGCLMADAGRKETTERAGEEALAKHAKQRRDNYGGVGDPPSGVAGDRNVPPPLTRDPASPEQDPLAILAILARANPEGEERQ